MGSKWALFKQTMYRGQKHDKLPVLCVDFSPLSPALIQSPGCWPTIRNRGLDFLTSNKLLWWLKNSLIDSSYRLHMGSEWPKKTQKGPQMPPPIQHGYTPSHCTWFWSIQALLYFKKVRKQLQTGPSILLWALKSLHNSPNRPTLSHYIWFRAIQTLMGQNNG